MVIIDDKELENLIFKAEKNQRLRMNRNLHDSLEDPFQRMLNALQVGSYVQPHRHTTPPKAESFVIVKGKLGVVLFDDEGQVEKHILLSREGPVYGVDIPPGRWHTILAVEDGTVAYEAKKGPYEPTSDKDFASWAPKPEESERVKDYVKGLEELFSQ